ncbi:hypothetical protein OIU77_029253 [Salix suchowensis]|uniref:Uncharacterized protein n=1 Tax=Salix suchowensis TaxID=1278906 RepID=A0ABQ9BMZ7_9ROSI|nr:hypothetical protein OIU77_029253 [Salix suchowensis]
MVHIQLHNSYFLNQKKKKKQGKHSSQENTHLRKTLIRKILFLFI